MAGWRYSSYDCTVVTTVLQALQINILYYVALKSLHTLSKTLRLRTEWPLRAFIRPFRLPKSTFPPLCLQCQRNTISDATRNTAGRVCLIGWTSRMCAGDCYAFPRTILHQNNYQININRFENKWRHELMLKVEDYINFIRYVFFVHLCTL